jgi:hypothetical protein
MHSNHLVHVTCKPLDSNPCIYDMARRCREYPCFSGTWGNIASIHYMVGGVEHARIVRGHLVEQLERIPTIRSHELRTPWTTYIAPHAEWKEIGNCQSSDTAMKVIKEGRSKGGRTYNFLGGDNGSVYAVGSACDGPGTHLFEEHTRATVRLICCQVNARR